MPASAKPGFSFTPLWRGFTCKCPNCGEGKLFRAFLKVADKCSVCGEEFHHHRADDFPAYVVMVIVGHIVVAAILAVEVEFSPPIWVHIAVWPALSLILSLSLLQPVKGAIVGLQWELHMHGFEQARRARLRVRTAEAKRS